MKPADCICKIDKLGRVLIPKTLRKKLDLRVDDPIEVFTDNDSIVLKKYRKRCVLCGSDDEVVEFREKHICRECLDELRRI
jgi:transcriptional pleiotropic regulator of transition state genes